MDAKKIAMTAAIALAAVFNLLVRGVLFILAAVFIARKIEPVNKIIFG